jgi:mannose-1-phosphate guanylyltransferase/phosphomannomutase
MKVILMAGGFGTRLRPLTSSLPKPMVPMVGKPMMEHIVELLAKHGFREIIVMLFHQPEAILSYFGDGSRWGVKLAYEQPHEDYGTAGCVKYAEPLMAGERCLVISGDLLTDFDLSRIVEFHTERKAVATITLTRIQNPLQYGIIITDAEGRIEKFLEKPTWGQVFSDTINTGIYVLEPEALAQIPPRREFDFSRDLFPILMEQKLPLYGCVAEGYWRDIGNLEEYRQAHHDVLHGEVALTISGNRLSVIGKDIWVGEGTEIQARNTQLRGAVIVGRNCRIGSGVKIEDSVIGDGSVIEEGASLSHSVLWNEVRIGRNALITNAIIGHKTEVGEGTVVEENAVIADRCSIGRNAIVTSNVKMWPQKSVEDGAVLSTSLVWGDKWQKEFFSGARVTGIANLEVTPEFAAKLGAAFGAYLGKGTLVVTSRDADPSSRMVNRALICGLLSAGVNVEDLRALPIPVVRYTLKSGRSRAGLHTRKSPFDARLSDILFFDEDGKDLPPGKVKSVERLFLREDFRRADYSETGKLDFPARVVEAYKDGFLDFVDAKVIAQAKLKVVLDYACGGATIIFPAILGNLGVEVVALNAHQDASRITKSKEEFEASLVQLTSIVVTLKADVGFLLDAGAEKVYLVDEFGSAVTGNQALAAVLLLVLRAVGAKRVAVPVTASSVIEDLARAHGAEVIRTRTDNLSLMEAAAQEGMDFVGGPYGAYIFPKFIGAFDAMLSVAKILEMMARTGTRFGALAKEVPEIIMVRENVFCPFTLKGTILRRLIEETKGLNRELVDGVKVFSDFGWVQVIPDASRPIFHVNAEAKTLSQAKHLVEDCIQKLERWKAEG